MRTSRGAACFLLLLAACAGTPHENASQEIDENTVDLELTTGPRASGLMHVGFPLKQAVHLEEGWVDLNFMIDPNGKTYEVVVTDSTGSKAFEEAALKAAKKWHFKPAMSADEPTEIGYGFRVYFTHPFAQGLSKPFARTYEQAVAAIAEGDRARAELLLAQLTVQNLTEDAAVGLAKYQFEAKWGTEAAQIAALRRALAMEPSSRYLPRSQVAAALLALLPLELRAKDFASAMSTWTLLKAASYNRPRIASWRAIIDDATALRTDDRAYAVAGEIDASASSWFYVLYKRRFQVAVSSGHVSEIKLRCDRRYVSFGFDPALYYRIADKYGTCRLELIGEPGTVFDLIQS
jgi:TonB family protein